MPWSRAWERLLIGWQALDFRVVTLHHDERISAFYTEWDRRFREHTDTQGPFACI